ncbi:MAG TPA: monovalent cation/H(+) antiporter subunit G [Blastocatellia bacterium]|nr:monovalent cation/H(+) antiporter subunit G [Blastocatellia bacterium]
MRDVISLILMLIGAFFMFVATVGVARMPDLFLRMSATSKSATLGAACILLAAAVHFNDFGIITRAVATIAFLFMTAPVAAHRIGRAAYFLGVPLWEGTTRDDLRGKYDEKTHLLFNSPEPPAGETQEEPH